MKLESVFVHSMWFGKVKSSNLLQALCDLPPEAQLALYMKYWEDKEDFEIAHKLRVTEIFVISVMGDAIKKLRLILGDRHSNIYFAA